MKTYKQRLHENVQSRLRELRQTLDTIQRLDPSNDAPDVRTRLRALEALTALTLSKTQRKKLVRKYYS